MTSLYPEVRDLSTLTGVFKTDSLLPVGVEGEMAATGTTATLGTPETITTAEEAIAAFGVASPLTLLVSFLLARGLPSVRAVASDDAAPNLAARQAAWATLAEDPTIRIRLTDSAVQADLVALADSCEQAELIQNKQFMFGALASPNVKATLTTAAAAIASKRGILMGPGVYDSDGVLRSGAYAAAMAAVEVARNPDIVDSLNLAPLGATTGIEKDATGLPIFRLRVNGGSPVNDHADLLDDGVSTFIQGVDGRAAFSHLRMTYTTDDTYDALMTLLIKDETFLGIRDMLLAGKYHRRPNNESTRNLAAAETDNWLKAHNDWVEPVELSNGDVGYGVTVTPSVDLKSFTVAYFGNVVRGTNVINVNGTLTIPVGQ